MTKTEQRIEDLEIKFTYQETTLDALNEVISRQQQQLDRLEVLCNELRNRLRVITDDGGIAHTMSEGERPPHY